MQAKLPPVTITLNGQDYYWYNIVDALDRFRSDPSIQVPERRRTTFCKRIVPIQELLCDYAHGRVDISEVSDSFYARNSTARPTASTLPEAISELLGELESGMNLDFSRMYEHASDLYNYSRSRVRKEQEAETARRELVQGFLVETPYDKEAPVTQRIYDLASLLTKKESSSEYQALLDGELCENDRAVSVLYPEVLLESLHSDTLSLHVFQSLVNRELIGHEQLQSIFDAIGWEHDLEWYLEDYISYWPDELTTIPAQAVLSECEDEWIRLLGIG